MAASRQSYVTAKAADCMSKGHKSLREVSSAAFSHVWNGNPSSLLHAHIQTRDDPIKAETEAGSVRLNLYGSVCCALRSSECAKAKPYDDILGKSVSVRLETQEALRINFDSKTTNSPEGW
ncbi:hypothetical protein AMECASPLE_024167 [Ameca splendens]|uniref:Uncharacterized protein n=1 Tax=Ameca splendens TaxID=208324 RepID=A0ABV1AB59_9TELE